MSHWTNRLIALGAIAGAVCPATAAFARTTTPNIVLIVADDLGTDQLGLYGLNRNPPRTPNIDALAARGQIYEEAWSNPTCSPTRASLYTGRHAFRHGVGAAIVNPGTDPELRTSELTLAEALEGRGYTSTLIGKWHLGDDGAESNACEAPFVHGWDVFDGALAGAVPDHYDWPKCRGSNATQSRTWTATEQVDDALAFLATAGDQPFMLTVAFHLPHTPWQIPPSGTYESAGSCPVDRTTTIANRDCYRAMIESMDFEIGRLMSAIDPAQTVVMLIGDNGTPVQGVARGTYAPNRAKGTVYQGGVRVPMIISGPPVTDHGWVDAPVNVLDLFATAIELAGASAPSGADTDAVSLVPYFDARNRRPLKATVYTEGFAGADDCSFGDAAAIRGRRYKLVRHACARDELYDLVADPFERKDLLTGTLTGGQQAAYRRLNDAMVELRGR